MNPAAGLMSIFVYVLTILPVEQPEGPMRKALRVEERFIVMVNYSLKESLDEENNNDLCPELYSLG
jgi:hypothetical protein